MMVDSLALRETYDRDYFLGDCGGYEAFLKWQGRRIEDARLAAVAAIAEIVPSPKRVLDLGCGRGELSQYFARLGAQVTAVDYSQAAIELARSAVAGDADAASRIEWRCESVLDTPLADGYDLAIAVDLIEHMAEAELDRLYARVAEALAPGGVFVVHTFPNLWHYRYAYPRRRRAAALRGEVLPAEPRSAYEQLMHINEQNPRTMRRQLRRAFPQVLFWIGDERDPRGNLGASSSLAEQRDTAGAAGTGSTSAVPRTLADLREMRSLYAVASVGAVDADRVLEVLSMPAQDDALARSVRVTVEAQGTSPIHVTAGQAFALPVRLGNDADLALRSQQPHPINLSYHWLAPTGELRVLDGLRTPLLPALAPGESRSIEMAVQAPHEPGDWQLCVTLVQEGLRWFDGVESGARAVLRVTVDRPAEQTTSGR